MTLSNIDLQIALFNYLIDPLVLEIFEGLGTLLLEKVICNKRLYGSVLFQCKDLAGYHLFQTRKVYLNTDVTNA